MVAWLIMFALLSTGEFFFFWATGLILIIKVMSRLIREMPSGIERTLVRFISQVFMMIFLLSVVLPLVVAVIGISVEAVLMVWFYIGYALMPLFTTVILLRWLFRTLDRYTVTIRIV